MSSPTAGADEAVEFYWRPGCPFCVALRARLRKSGIPVREVNIWEDPAAAARVRAAANGNETVPTVFLGGRSLVNPTMAQVETLVRDAAPHLAPTPRSAGRRRRRWPFS